MRGRPGRRTAALLVAAACALGTAACAPARGATASGATASSGTASSGTASSGTAAVEGTPGATPAGATPAGATATGSPTAGAPTYLALGDSVPFGYRGGAGAAYGNPANFTGYPEIVGKHLGLRVLNASCPGETTASFLDPSAQSNGCENSRTSPFGYRTGFPLHVRYDPAGESQLGYAEHALATTPDIRLVTVQIGANDAFLCQDTTADRCLAPVEQQALRRTVRSNLESILGALRAEGHYAGRIVVVTYYALDYDDATGAATKGLDLAIDQAAQAQGAVVASGYDAFRPRATAAGGSSLTAGLVLPNDVHPTAAGQQLLAQAVEAVVPG